MLLVALLVATTAPAAALAPTVTIQQQFDAASAAFDAENWSAALPAFEQLAQRLPEKNHRNRAVVRLRMGVALEHLGRLDEASAALGEALRDLPADDLSLRQDRYLGWATLAEIDILQYDYSASLEAYGEADRLAENPARAFATTIGKVRSELFLDPKLALADIDRALAMEPASAPHDNERQGQLHDLRGRALLNDGQYVAARRELERAVGELGGLTSRVNAADIAARSDLAIASLLVGDDDAAKKYLANAGVGVSEDFFAEGTDMDPPECGNGTGLRPEDVAVVEFAIGDDGAVHYAIPVYVSRPGPAVGAFARAVSKWSWSPDKLAKIPLLSRLMTRVELRCSNAHPRPTIASIMDDAVRGWFGDQHLPIPPSQGGEATDLVVLRAELARRTGPGGVDTRAAAPILFLIARNAAAPRSERSADAERLRTLVLADAAPPLVRAAVAASPLLDFSAHGNFSGRSKRNAEIADAGRLLADPVIAADAGALNALRLRFADALLDIRSNDHAAALIDTIIADDRLSAHDPLRVGALIRRSSIDLARGDPAAARAAFAATGLSDTQCALVDAAPVVVRRSGSAADYPGDPMRWGISGWAVTEFDIAADGVTANVRTIAAYPPFVFDGPVEHIYQRTRFRQSYRPQGGPGCTSERGGQGFRVVS